MNHRRAQILAPHKPSDPWADADRPAGEGIVTGEGIGGPLDPAVEPPAPPALDPWRGSDRPAEG